MTSKVEEVGGTTAATPAALNRNPAKSGLAWSQCALVQIEGQEAFAKFGGGGHGDVPTVRGAAIIPNGGNVVWELKIEKKFASSPMRIGVQLPQVRVGLNWNDRACTGQAWYLDSQGDMYDGPNIYTETDTEFKQGDVVQVTLGYNRLAYSINGSKVRGELEGIRGEVQLAVQLFHKGDKVLLVSQHVPDEEEEAALEAAEEERHQRLLEDQAQREAREEEARREAEEEERRRREEEEEAERRRIEEEAAAAEAKRKEEEEAAAAAAAEEEEAERLRREEEEAAAAAELATDIGGEDAQREVMVEPPEVAVSMAPTPPPEEPPAKPPADPKSGPCPCC